MQELRTLDERRQGIEGVVGSVGDGYGVSLRFGTLAFDPTQLPGLVADASKIAQA